MSFKFNALTGGFNTFTQADLTSIGGSNDLSFDDNAKIKVGTGDDLEIYHTGSHSLIKNDTGYLQLVTDSFAVNNNANSENIISALANGAVNLYYDNSKKFETISTGVRATGNYQLPFADGNTGLRDKLQWVTEASYFDEVAYISVNRTAVSGAPSDMVFATGSVGSVSERLKIDSSGNVQIPNDSGKLQLGTSQDLEIYHDGSNSYIGDTGTGGLRVVTGDFRVMNSANNELMIFSEENGRVSLYYDNSEKFKTESTGIGVTGNVDATGNLYGASLLLSSNAFISDNNKLNLGTGNDLQLYHDGSHSFIKDDGTGNLHIDSVAGSVKIRTNTNEDSLVCTQDGGVSLYYDNALKLQTNTLGVSVGTTDTVIYDHNISDSYESGVVLDGAGSVQVARYNDQCLLLNRMGLDGTIESFYNDGTYVGGIAVSGATTVYATSSDYRLKENVTAISDGITRLKTLKPYRFNFISDTTKTVDGFFAHEVTAVPEAIVGEKDAEEMQSLDYAKLTPLLTAALQEAITKIETLETKVAALEAA